MLESRFVLRDVESGVSRTMSVGTEWLSVVDVIHLVLEWGMPRLLETSRAWQRVRRMLLRREGISVAVRVFSVGSLAVADGLCQRCWEERAWAPPVSG